MFPAKRKEEIFSNMKHRLAQPLPGKRKSQTSSQCGKEMDRTISLDSDDPGNEGGVKVATLSEKANACGDTSQVISIKHSHAGWYKLKTLISFNPGCILNFLRLKHFPITGSRQDQKGRLRNAFLSANLVQALNLCILSRQLYFKPYVILSTFQFNIGNFIPVFDTVNIIYTKKSQGSLKSLIKGSLEQFLVRQESLIAQICVDPKSTETFLPPLFLSFLLSPQCQ